MTIFHRYSGPLLGLISFVFIGTMWELSVRLGLVNPFLASSPTSVWSALYGQAVSGILLADLAASLYALVVGFGLAVVVGLSVGVLMGWYRHVEVAIDPFVWLGYSAPMIAFYPLFIALLGLGPPTIIAITFLFGVFPIVVNTIAGVKNVDAKLVQAARSFGATDRQLFRKVVMPASVPMIMAGLRLGVGRALVGVVVAELFGGNAGLGYRISYSGALMETGDMMASVIVVMVLGVTVIQLMTMVERHFDSWRPSG